MTKRLRAVLLAIAVATTMHALVQADIKVGQNVNIIAGIADQFIGDMFRQRQNEPAQWVFSVNTNHRMAAFNDYRTVDLADDTQIGTPVPAQFNLLARFMNLFRKRPARDVSHRATSAQAFIGLAFTDNAVDWYTGLHPGNPFDASGLFPELNANLPPGVVLDSGSDPVLAGTENRAYLAGIAFSSTTGHSRGFVSVWRDRNNAEVGPNIVWERGVVLHTTDDKFFIDKPSIAASPSGKVFAAFVRFDESDPNRLSSKIILFRSTNFGATWSGPTVLSQPLTRNQSPWILIDPNNDNVVYVGWRVFAAYAGGLTNAIVGRKSTNGGATFTPIVPYIVAGLLKAFDQPQVSLNPATLGLPNAQLPVPRSNAYPSAVIDGNGSIHAVFTEWVNPTFGTPLLPLVPISNGIPRVVITSSHNGGVTWTPRKAIDFGPGSGTQFMPIIAVAGEPGPSCPGKTGPRSRIAVMYYDARETTKTSYLSNVGQFDVRVVEASACVKDALGRLVFGPSQLVSQYARSAAAPHDILPTTGCDPAVGDRCSFKAVNRAYNNFGGGLNSFTGDYNHLVPIPPYVKTASGQWRATTATGVDKNKLPGASWQGAWADARDVVLPMNPLPAFLPTHPHFLASLPWGNYQPPHSGVPSNCFNPGSRDQNIYTAAMTPGLYAAAPVTFKSSNIPRDYPVVVENATNQSIFVRLTIERGADGLFHAQFNTPGPGVDFQDTFADIAIGPFSSVTGSVVVLPGSQAPIVITLAQITEIGPTATVVPNGLKTSVTLNTAGDGDGSNSETRSPSIDPEPEITKPFGNIDPVTGTEITEEGSPYVQTPFGKNPFGKNPFGKNPFGKNPLAGDIFDATDVSFTVTNDGSHAAAFNAIANVQNELLLTGGGYVFQVIISRISLTPDLDGCETVESQVDNQVSNIQNPFAKNPFGKNPFGKNPFGKNPFGKNGAPDDFDDPGVTNSTFFAAPNAGSSQAARRVEPVEGKPGERMALSSPAPVRGSAPGVVPAGFNPAARSQALPRFTSAGAPVVQVLPSDFRDDRPDDQVVYTLRVFQVKPACVGPDTPDCLTPEETFGADELKNELSVTVASQRPSVNEDGVFDPAGGETTSAGAQVPTHLVFTVQPADTPEGQTLPAVQVAVRDVFGATVTDSTAPVTIAIGSNPGEGTLAGTTTRNAVNGIATFDNLSINNAASGYTLVASSPALTSATSESFDILTAAPQATRLAFTIQPSNEIAGEPISPAIEVTVQDASGNTVSDSSAPITLSFGANPGAGTLFGTLTQNAVEGVATFSSVTINNPAPGYTLVASSPGLMSATSTPFDILPQDVLFVPNTDYVSAGVGGMRGGSGASTIALQGVGGPVTRAILYWNGPTDSTDGSANASVIFNGTPITGTNIGLSDNNCWGFANSHSYRADVTTLVSGNGIYSLANFRKVGPPRVDINGVSLLVFFNDETSTNDVNVYIFDGNDSNVASAFDGAGWDRTMGVINVPGGSAVGIEFHVADGQRFSTTDDGAIFLNGNQWLPQAARFSGESVPGPSISLGNLWDVLFFPIPVDQFLAFGDNTIRLTSPLGGDCLGLVVTAVIVDPTPVIIQEEHQASATRPQVFTPFLGSCGGGGRGSR
jgi:hypothetical protein